MGLRRMMVIFGVFLGFRKVKGVKYKGAKVEYQRVKGKKSPKIEQLS